MSAVRVGLVGYGNAARFHVPACHLLPGDYELSVNIYRGKSGAHALVEEALSALTFKVVTVDFVDRGLFLLPGSWTIT